MALINSSAILCAVVLFSGIAVLFGHRLLRLISLNLSDKGEPLVHLLCSVAVGVISLEVLFFLVELSGRIKAGVAVVLAFALLVGLGEARPVWKESAIAFQGIRHGSRFEKGLASLIAVVLLFEALSAMAPLTGSDALRYHFTAPLFVVRSGFHPDFSLAHSFFTGQSHLLILAGLALGSSQFAMGLMFLGGVLAAAAGSSLVRCWTSRTWALVFGVLFLVTPVVFWQISSAGAPDLWMAFFTTLGVLVISRSENYLYPSHAILCGALAGAVAGSKYTGCIVAATMALAYLWEVRSFRKLVPFLLSSLGIGLWPYARNLLWTGDPLFPFLTRWFSPDKVNAYTLASVLADTGAATHRSLWQILKSPLFASIDSAHLGFWQFFGPLVLAFAPFLLLAIGNRPGWRVALTVWVLSALGTALSSDMTRFLLPVFPIALAAVLSGAAQLPTLGWKFARGLAIATLIGVFLFGAAGMVLYDSPALATALGITSREDYLRTHAPDYEVAQFINQALAGKETGNSAVFLQHLFYLRVPFLNCNPDSSWVVNPAKLQSTEQWLEFFRDQNIRWVVRSPRFPRPIAAPLDQLEAQGKLVPVAQSEVTDFHGFRIAGERQSIPIVVLQVKR